MINLSRWAIDEASVVPQQPYTCFIPELFPYFAGGYILPCMANVHVANGSSKIFLITPRRVLHELDLELLDDRDDGLRTQRYLNYGKQPYCQKHYEVARTGCQVVGVYTSCNAECNAESNATSSNSLEEQTESLELSRTRTELKFADLSGTIDQNHTIELDYLDSHSPFYYPHSITFSPDLSMLRAGEHIFDLAAPGQPQLRFPDSPLTGLRYGMDLSIAFSPCNGYLTCIEGSIYEAKDKPATFGLFRICRAARSIERISIIGLEDLIADVVGADFHPTLPLLILTCMAYKKTDVKDLAKSMKIIEIDLEVLRPVQVTLPEHELDMAYL